MNLRFLLAKRKWRKQMNNILSEKEYQRYIIDELTSKNGYIERPATGYDRFFAVDREMLFGFLNATQSDTMSALKKVYKDKLEELGKELDEL